MNVLKLIKSLGDPLRKSFINYCVLRKKRLNKQLGGDRAWGRLSDGCKRPCPQESNRQLYLGAQVIQLG